MGLAVASFKGGDGLKRGRPTSSAARAASKAGKSVGSSNWIRCIDQELFPCLATVGV